MKRAILLVFVTGLIIGVSYGMHGPILPVFAKNDIGASYSELGLVGFASFAPYMAIPLFVGVLLTRFNNAYLLILGASINAVSVYMLSVAQSVPELIAYRLMTGIAHAFFWPPCISVIHNAGPRQDRVKNISLFTMFFVIGFMVGPLAGNALIDEADVTHRSLFQITAAVMSTAVIAALLLAHGRRMTGTYGGFSWGSLVELARFKTVMLLLVYCTASLGVILAIFPAFLDDNDVSDADILFLYFIFGISRVATLAATDRLARRTEVTLACAAFATAGGMLVTYWTDSIAGFAVALSLIGFGISAFFPLTLEIVLTRTRGAVSGAIIGAYETVFGIGWVAGPIMAGYVSQFQGNEAPYIIFFVLGIGVGMTSIVRRGSLRPHRQRHEG